MIKQALNLPLYFNKQKGSNSNVSLSYRYISFCVFLRATQVGLEMKYGVSNNGLFRGEVVTPVCNLEPPSHQATNHCHLFIADSVQTEYCSTFHCSCVRSCVTGVTSHISHIYKGINAMLIIRGPIKPYIF